MLVALALALALAHPWQQPFKNAVTDLKPYST